MKPSPEMQAMLHNLVCWVDEAKDDVLMMSRRHCHAPLVDSIVFRKDDGGELWRAFLAWPGNNLCTNFPGSRFYQIGIHDHRYALSLWGLVGRPIHYEYEVVDDFDGEALVEHNFVPGVTDSSAKAEAVGLRWLRCTRVVPLGDRFDLPADRLHTVFVPRDEYASWLIVEGPSDPQKQTKLYTAGRPMLGGLYETFTNAAEVREYVRAFVEAVEKAVKDVK